MGRRIAYLLHRLAVRACEIYASHDMYTRVRTKGWRKADYQETHIWFEEGGIDAARNGAAAVGETLEVC